MSELRLPKGIDPEKLRKAVAASGYPLQSVVAKRLDQEFRIIEEWGYVDRNSGEHRSLDLYAFRKVLEISERLELGMTLLIECKKSEFPYVLFPSVVPLPLTSYPTITGFPRFHFELRSEAFRRGLSAAQFLKLHEGGFVSPGPTRISSFARVEPKGQQLGLSGTLPYTNLLLPLASAHDHYVSTRQVPNPRNRYFATLVLCVAVVDAPLVLAQGTPENPELSNASWVRVVREEAVQEGKRPPRQQYVVELVHRDALSEFLKALAAHTEEVASRMSASEPLVFSGKAHVPDLDSWKLADLKPSHGV